MSRRSSEQWARRVDGQAGVEVDVLLPTCNRPAELAVTLAGLAAQAEPAFAVVISDQSTGSPGWEHPAAAAMVRVLQAQGPSLTLLRHLPCRGLAEHRQFLLDHSTAEKCLFLDDDVWLEPGALERFGGAGILPSGAVHLESPTTVTERQVEAYDVVLGEEQAG